MPGLHDRLAWSRSCLVRAPPTRGIPVLSMAGCPGQAMQRMPAARGHDHRLVDLRAPLRYPGPRDQRRGATGAPGCSAELFETTASAAAARWLGLPTWPGHRTVGVPAISRLPAPAGAAG